MRASSDLLDHNAAGASPERYTHIFISSIDRIGSRQGDLGGNCEAFVFYQRKRRSRSFDSVQPLEDRMQRFHHLGGIAAITLTALGLQYVWIAGQYVQRPAPSANWVPGYWQQGPNG